MRPTDVNQSDVELMQAQIRSKVDKMTQQEVNALAAKTKKYEGYELTYFANKHIDAILQQ